ncbi:hypothetical protein ACFLS9_08950, partial [Bacteroidota bacterium]
MLTKIIFTLFFTLAAIVSAQNYLSNLNATKNKPMFTTYAAPMNRSGYKIDQGYQLMWYDDESSVDFISSDGGDICVAFNYDGMFRYKLRQFYIEPVITASYSDL